MRFGMEALLESQRNDLEKAMWTAVRIIEQNSRLLDRLISECVQRRQEPMAAIY
jgi:hypothetical protein